MPRGSGITPNTSIRVDKEALHQARIAALIGTAHPADQPEPLEPQVALVAASAPEEQRTTDPVVREEQPLEAVSR